jgi:transcription initiation factor TFIIB
MHEENNSNMKIMNYATSTFIESDTESSKKIIIKIKKKKAINKPNEFASDTKNEIYLTPKEKINTNEEDSILSKMESLTLYEQKFETAPQRGVRSKLSMEFPVENSNGLNESNVDNKKSRKTKKKRDLSVIDKKKLWDLFDEDKKEIDTELECIYSKEIGLCNLCNSNLIIMEDGFPTCTNINCGVIYKDTLDYSPEWRFYNGENKNATDTTRCGNPINPLLVESSFGCKVLCTAKSSYEMKKIRKWTEWQSMPHKEKSLYDEFQFITTMAQNAGIPRIFIADAMAIHKDISEQKMFRGMNRDSIKSASIYISCRLNGFPRTAHEIAEIFHLDKMSATNGCSMAVNILHNIERNMEPSQQAELFITLPSSFIERFCSRLNINKELMLLSKFIANKIEKNNYITDNIPHAIAGGIVYFIAYNCNLSITKQDIKHICGVSEVTINKCFKKLELIKEQLLPSSVLKKYSI